MNCRVVQAEKGKDMKLCDKCKHAQWDRTEAGRLHPGKQGKCTFPWKMPDLPQAFYFPGGDPSPAGGFILRGVELPRHCAYFARAT